nr:hypothetical protein CFP56_49340 [Quercus suber]
MSEKEEERQLAVKKRRDREAEEVELDEMKSMEEKEPVEEDEAVNISISHNSSQDLVRRIHDDLKLPGPWRNQGIGTS